MADLVGAPDLRKSLGGDIEIDFGLSIPLLKYSSPFGQFKVRYPCELNCESFDALGTPECRWRNELSDCCESGGEELDWVRVKNGWGLEEGITIFGTEQRAARYSILVGAQEKRAPNDAALLVSDPLQCQEGDGILKFRYWTSPHTVIKVCTRPPGLGREYTWCGKDITKGDPGPAEVVIPGSIMQDFELVIEASHFDYDAFGFQGGVVILDDIEYNATAIYNCRNIPHIEPLVPLPIKTCDLLECEFNELDRCYLKLRRTGWRHSQSAIGNRQTGIRNLHDGAFVYVKGRGKKPLNFGEFSIPRQLLMEFCTYIASQDAHIAVEAHIKGYERQTLSEITEDPNLYHKWDCRRVVLQPGNYTELSFVVQHLPYDLAYVGLDGIHLYEMDGGTRPCFTEDPITELALVSEVTDAPVDPFSTTNSTDLKLNSQLESQGLVGFSNGADIGSDAKVDFVSTGGTGNEITGNNGIESENSNGDNKENLVINTDKYGPYSSVDDKNGLGDVTGDRPGIDSVNGINGIEEAVHGTIGSDDDVYGRTNGVDNNAESGNDILGTNGASNEVYGTTDVTNDLFSSNGDLDEIYNGVKNLNLETNREHNLSFDNNGARNPVSDIKNSTLYVPKAMRPPTYEEPDNDSQMSNLQVSVHKLPEFPLPSNVITETTSAIGFIEPDVTTESMLDSILAPYNDGAVEDFSASISSYKALNNTSYDQLHNLETTEDVLQDLDAKNYLLQAYEANKEEVMDTKVNKHNSEVEEPHMQVDKTDYSDNFNVENIDQNTMLPEDEDSYFDGEAVVQYEALNPRKRFKQRTKRRIRKPIYSEPEKMFL
ncbi:unnamed protein product [Bursaphelenchus okinawaensis]|uniref:MAM domain-containing protein n=1 Tax=Bursaphelenchus okinawaensis TaxID=465554 RepID=A0A811KCJ9_9BILA|nr:unnamed protein product [Bursaphelenchus okinawaensis]CAG9099117.1 unnamed protein product [Bursaphelenchus okinawaensis]